MRELNVDEIRDVNGGINANRGAMAEGLIAAGCFALGMTGVGILAIGAALVCVAMMED